MNLLQLTELTALFWFCPPCLGNCPTKHSGLMYNTHNKSNNNNYNNNLEYMRTNTIHRITVDFNGSNMTNIMYIFWYFFNAIHFLHVHKQISFFQFAIPVKLFGFISRNRYTAMKLQEAHTIHYATYQNQ